MTKANAAGKRPITIAARLRYFRAVARSGSIRAASTALNVAPSAISRQIANLEAEMGMALFDRAGKGMELTDAGRRYEAYALTVTNAMRELSSELDDLRGLRTGSVHIVSIEGLVVPFVSRAISAFQKTYPNVAFTVEIVGAREVLRRIVAGSADIGIAFNAPTSPEVEYILRRPDPIVAVMHPDADLATRRELSFAEVLSGAFAVPVKGFGIRDLVDFACSLEGLSLSPAMETSSIEAMRAFARGNDGIALLHRMAIAGQVAEGSVVTRPITAESLASGTLDLCMPSRTRPPIAARSFAEVLRDGLNDEMR